MFLIKFSRPDIANLVRELSKVNSGALESHYKVLLRIIKYVIDMRYYGLKYDLRKIKVNDLSTK